MQRAGQPYAALPPCRRQKPADAAHHQHRGEGPEAEGQHDEKAGKRRGGARRLRGEGIDQRTGQEAVENAEARSAPLGCASRAGCAGTAASALPPKPIASAVEAVEQAEELQRHGDHQQPGDDGEDPLGGVERAGQRRRRHCPAT